MTTARKLNSIIRFLDMSIHCVIWQCDTNLENDEPEKIFEGAVMDIPWYILDFYLYNDEDGEAIDVRLNDEKPIMVISVVEDKNRLKER